MSHEHQHNHDGCHCSCHEGECPSCHCHCDAGHHHHHEGDFAAHLLDMADEAWMEVLFEKLKKQIEASDGKRLDELSKIVSDANRERWKHKLAKQKVSGDYREQIARYFGE